MAVVAALFDSDSDATMAMDKLMHMHLHDVDTRLFGQREDNTNASPTTVLPLVPNTGAQVGQTGGFLPFAGRIDWLDELDDEAERGFYYEALKEGGILALAKVDDADAPQVRQLFRQSNARTYQEK